MCHASWDNAIFVVWYDWEWNGVDATFGRKTRNVVMDISQETGLQGYTQRHCPSVLLRLRNKDDGAYVLRFWFLLRVDHTLQEVLDGEERGARACGVTFCPFFKCLLPDRKFVFLFFNGRIDDESACYAEACLRMADCKKE